jgi:glycosyltransferase involved in cell wall biosynthesis
MNILIIHEIDWIKKVIFEPHHLAELLSLHENNVFVIDCQESNIHTFFSGIHTKVVSNYHRVYDDASITLVHPPSILLKGLNRLSHFFTCKKIIKKIIIEKNIDVILLYGTATNGVQTIELAKQLKIPVIFRSLDVAHGLVKIPVIRQLAKICEKKVFKNATKILPTTPLLSNYAISMGAKKEKIEYFPLGVNFECFKPLEKDINLAHDLGISKNDLVIVFMGTLYDFAGLHEIISKFNILKNNLKSIKFLIVGGGPSEKSLRLLVKQKNLQKDIFFTGFISQHDVPKYIALADLCINPFQINNITENILPTKILEYFSCKKPVLSTPLKGTIDLLPSEKYGIIYIELENFVQKLLQLLKNKQKLSQLGENGYQYVLKNHDWKEITSNLILILKNKQY